MEVIAIANEKTGCLLVWEGVNDLLTRLLNAGLWDSFIQLGPFSSRKQGVLAFCGDLVLTAFDTRLYPENAVAGVPDNRAKKRQTPTAPGLPEDGKGWRHPRPRPRTCGKPYGVVGGGLSGFARIVALKVVRVEEKFCKAELAGDLDVELHVGDVVRTNEGTDAVAVLPVVGGDGDESVDARRMVEKITTGLVNRDIPVVERRLMDAVSDELAEQQDKDVFDPSTAQSVGSRVGAFAVLVGTITPENKYSRVQMRLVEVETGKVLTAFSHILQGTNLGVALDTEERSGKAEGNPVDRSPNSQVPSGAVGFRGHRYFVYTRALSPKDAEKYCNDRGGYLARIESAEEQRFVLGLLSTVCPNSPQIWIGGSDEKREGEWVFPDGSPLRYSNWGPESPNNRGNEDYVCILWITPKNPSLRGRWDDKRPHKRAFVCEWSD
ncbi:MAG: FlgO family outer membrane protein [Planctomycetota bacterium]